MGLDALARWVAPDGGACRRPRLAAVLLAAYGLFAATYVPINLLSVGRPAHRLWLPGEERLPLIPAFEFLYVLSYVIPLLLLVRPPDARRFRQAVPAFGLVLLVAYVTYLLFPVYLERPAFQVNSLATWLLWLEYHDPSYNHFPSLHVALSWLVYFAGRDAFRRRGAIVLLLVGVSASTLFVKQHYVVDVAYGVALAAGAWWASGLAANAVARATTVR